MNKATRKIIAREFLVLLATIIILILTSILLSYISNQNHNKEWELKIEIQDLTAPKEPPYRLNLFYYINREIIGTYGEDRIEDRKGFITALDSDKEYAKQLYDWMANKSHRPETTKEEYLIKISEDADSEKYLSNLIKLENDLEETESSLDFGDDEDIIALAVFLFSLTFLLRYLFYATKWSIRELKAT